MKCIVDVCCLSELRASGGCCLTAGSKSGLLCLLTNVPQTLALKFKGLCVTLADDWTGGQLRFLGQGLIAACRRRGEIQTAS